MDATQPLVAGRRSGLGGPGNLSLPFSRRFPWNLLGTSQYQLTPLIQIASVTDVYGVSFLVVWVSLAMFSAVRAIFSKPSSRFAWQPEIFLPLLVVALLFAYGSVQMRLEVKTNTSQPPIAYHADSAERAAKHDLGFRRKFESFPRINCAHRKSADKPHRFAHLARSRSAGI
ncbi:MAG: hypothetical protein WDM80_08720 [Limisphaerales bacterium]